MTELHLTTDPIARLDAETDAVSSRPGHPRANGCNLTEEPAGCKPTQSKRATSRHPRTKPRLTPQSAKATSKKPRTKKVVLVGLLGRKSGATMQAMMDATGWQAHSLRAALSGLRKSGIAVERRSNRKGQSVYALSPAGQP